MRQEQQACAVTSLFGDGYTLQQDKFVGNLYHDTGTVARFGVGTLRSAVHHMFKHLETFLHELM